MRYTQEKCIIGAGVWLVILPFTGFPRGLKTVLTVLTGVFLLYVGALIYKRVRTQGTQVTGEIHTGTFTETTTIAE